MAPAWSAFAATELGRNAMAGLRIVAPWSASAGSSRIAMSSTRYTGSSTAPLLQSSDYRNIIFDNIDWKRSRHDSAPATRRNLQQLADTTTSIVTCMNPAVICFCEVGEAMKPMSKEQMAAVADTIRRAWEAAATDHPALLCLFEEGAPYLTIWDSNRCTCKHGRTLQDVYNVQGHRRTAQAFLCLMPGETDEQGIDVVNVHAPSGSPKLTDAQRHQLLRNLLKSSSMARRCHDQLKRIGQGRFLIGGDMNTFELRLSQILSALRIEGILLSRHEVLKPIYGKHGDICVLGGFNGASSTERATLLPLNGAHNHDPNHCPYGISWRSQARHATEKPPTTPHPQIPTAPDATLQRHGLPQQQLQPSPQDAAVRPVRHMPQRPLGKASASAWSATEQPGVRLTQADEETALPAVPTQQPSPTCSWSFHSHGLYNRAGTFGTVPWTGTYVSAWTATEQPDELLAQATAETTLPQLPLENFPTSSWPATEQPGRSATEPPDDLLTPAATEITLPTTPKQQPHRDPAVTGSPTEQPRPVPQDVDVRPEGALSQPPLEEAAASAWPATEQPDVARPQADAVAGLWQLQTTGTYIWPATAQSAATEVPWVTASAVAWPATWYDQEEPPERWADVMEAAQPMYVTRNGADSVSSRLATEQPRPDEVDPPALNAPEHEIAYVIVNAFLANVSFGSDEAEGQIMRIILATHEWPPDMLHDIDEVFRPIFFYYPNGLNDRTRAEPRDACQYIRQWREIAQWGGSAGEREAPRARLADSQVKTILHRYVANFIANEATEEQKRVGNKSYLQSCAEARLRRLCGSTLMAKAIWSVGLPNIPEAALASEKLLAMLGPATEQHSRPGRDALDAIAVATETILSWLFMLATTIKKHKASSAYQEHARKSGTKKHQSGLTAAELKEKQEKKRGRGRCI